MGAEVMRTSCADGCKAPIHEASYFARPPDVKSAISNSWKTCNLSGEVQEDPRARKGWRGWTLGRVLCSNSGEHEFARYGESWRAGAFDCRAIRFGRVVGPIARSPVVHL